MFTHMFCGFCTGIFLWFGHFLKTNTFKDGLNLCLWLGRPSNKKRIKKKNENKGEGSTGFHISYSELCIQKYGQSSE